MPLPTNDIPVIARSEATWQSSTGREPGLLRLPAHNDNGHAPSLAGTKQSGIMLHFINFLFHNHKNGDLLLSGYHAPFCRHVARACPVYGNKHFRFQLLLFRNNPKIFFYIATTV
jgi:hypothetical protein